VPQPFPEAPIGTPPGKFCRVHGFHLVNGRKTHGILSGQLTLPGDIREALNVKEGDYLDVAREDLAPNPNQTSREAKTRSPKR